LFRGGRGLVGKEEGKMQGFLHFRWSLVELLDNYIKQKREWIFKVKNDLGVI
jgi:hypothetical protein